MITLKLGIRNLIGAGMRTWLNVLATSISFTIILLFNSMYDGMKEDSQRIITDTEVAGGQYWHPEYDSYDPLTIEDSHSLLPAEVQQLVDNDEAMPILVRQVTIYAAGRSKVAIMKGVPTDQNIVRMPTNIISDYDGDFIPAMIGRGMSKSTDLQAGDLFTMRWLDADGTYDADEFEVIDIMMTENYKLDFGQIWMPLETMQEMLGMPNEATYVVVSQASGLSADEGTWVKREMQFFLQELQDAIDADQMWANAIYALLLFIAGLGIFNSQVLAIFRRRKEIGTLLALGMTRKQVIKLFTFEGGLHGVLALIVGAAYGSPLFYWLATSGIPMPYGDEAGVVTSGAMYPVFGLQLILGTMLLVAVTVTIVSYLPARQIAKLNPTDALRGRMN